MGTLAKEAGLVPGAKVFVTIGDQQISATFAVTYDDVPKGEWLALVNAEQVIEIARNLANAAHTIGAGAQVRLELRQPPTGVK